MMSNQCLNIFNHPSFYLFTSFNTPLKPYSSTFRFRSNCITIGRKSSIRTSSRNKLFAAQSSSDIVLIATTEHPDGSLVFRFGDVSEVVENDDLVEEIESETGKVVVVLDGDVERQVIVNTIEVDDGIRNADIESDVTERETTVISDLRDDLDESSEKLVDVSDEEVISLQSETNVNSSFDVVENTLDETECTAQLDGNESTDPTISLLDDSPNRDKSADPEGIRLKDSKDESEDPSVSVMLESRQVSEIEVEDVKQPCAEDELEKVETEDTSESDREDFMNAAITATMHISDVELTVVEIVNVEEELEDMISNEDTLIDEMPPFDTLDLGPTLVEVSMEVSSTKAMDVKDQAMEDELQQVSIDSREVNDAPYVTHVSRIEEAEPIVEEELSELRSTPLELNPTMQVSDIELQDVMDRNLDDGILQVSDESEDPSVSVKLETTQGSLIEVMDVTQPYIEDELHEVDPEDTIEGDTEDLLPPATMHNSDVELTDAANENMEEGLQDKNSSDDALIDRIPPSVQLGAEPTLDELSQLQRSDVKPEATMEVSIKDQAIEDDLQNVITDYGEENDFANVMPAKPILEDEVSEIPSTPLVLKPAMQVSDIELQDTIGQNLDDRSLKAHDKSEDPSVSVKLETMQVSQVEIVDDTQPYPKDELHMVETEDTSEGDTEALLPPATMHISDVELTDAAIEDMEEGLLDMNISEDILIDMPPYEPLGAEPTLDEVGQLQSSHIKLEATMEIVTTKSTGVKDQAVANEFQEVITDDRDENDVENEMLAEPILEELSQPQSTPVTMQVSDIEVEAGQNLDDGILQVIDEEAGDSSIKVVEWSSHQLEAQTVQDKGVNDMLEQDAETDALRGSIQLKEDDHDLLLEGERTEGNSREPAEESEDIPLLLATETEVNWEEIYSPDDFLSSGATFLEHPYKALTGGDDAYLLAGSNWLGVANGVSQWSFEGTDPGIYAKELMRTCEEIVLDTSSVPMTNPVELLCRGVKETNMSGSSNILIANFDGQALHVANIGDTGFLIIRHGAIFKKSSPLLHEFHFALQVEDSDDPLQLVEEYTIELDEGDIVVSATDGLFDNLYEREIAMIVSKSQQAGMKPEEIANVLATRAQDVGRSAFVRSPFSDAAQAAGYTGYSGGKPDNVVVIVSLVRKISNLLTE